MPHLGYLPRLNRFNVTLEGIRSGMATNDDNYALIMLVSRRNESDRIVTRVEGL